MGNKSGKVTNFLQKIYDKAEKENTKIKTKKKINPFKKIYFSLRFQNYDLMAKDGVTSAMTYLLIISIILALIVSVFAVYKTVYDIEDSATYLAQNLPEFSYAEGKISTEGNVQTIELSGDNIKRLVGADVVIDINTENQETIENYEKSFGEENGLVVLKNKIIVVTNNEENKTYSYEEYIKQTYGIEINSFNKQDIINALEQLSYSQYFVTILFNYLSRFLFIFLYNTFIISIFGYIISRIIELKEKYKIIYMKSIYTYILPAILYTAYIILNLLTNFVSPYLADSFAFLGIIVLIIVLVKDKKKQKMENVKK